MPKIELPTTYQAIRDLGSREDAAALELITGAAASDDQFLRRTAIEVIGNHPQVGSLHAIILRALTDPSEYVVRTACNVVAKCRIAEAHDRVSSILASRSGATRETALRALSTVWQDADFSVVFRIFQNDPEIEVRRGAASVLRAHADAKNWRTVFDAFHSDELARHRQWACEIAAALSNVEIVRLLSRLTLDSDGHVRKAASRAIETILARQN
jgi:HEAT repeat protein